MAQIRNVSGQDLEVPGAGLVEADAVLTVHDDVVFSYTCQTGTWEPDDATAYARHSAGLEAYPATPAEEPAEAVDQADDQDDDPAPDPAPASTPAQVPGIGE